MTAICKISCKKRRGLSSKTSQQLLWLTEYDEYCNSFKFSSSESEAKIFNCDDSLIDEMVSHLRESWGMYVNVHILKIEIVKTIEFLS